MNEKQSINKNTYLIWIAVIFTALMIAFIMNLWGDKRVIKQNAKVNPKFISNNTVRDPLKLPQTQQAGFTYNCNNCHRNITPSKIPKKLMAAHREIIMEHGVNNRCLNCHQEKNRERLKDINGNEVLFSQSEKVCQQCHGPKYRDWDIGVHGRPNGYWDKSKGQESVKATCVACHNPHTPKFKPMEPAPAPVKESYYN